MASAKAEKKAPSVDDMAASPEVAAQFTVLSPGDEPVAPDPGHPADTTLQELHRLATRDMLAAEIVARSITEYPDMPWEFMLDMARICRDDVRCAEVRKRRIEGLGGRLGMYPIHPADWALHQHRVKLDLVYRLCDLALLGEDPLDSGLVAPGDAQKDSLTAEIRLSCRLDEQAEGQRHLRASVKWLEWLTADAGRLWQIIERGRKLRVNAGLRGPQCSMGEGRS